MSVFNLKYRDTRPILEVALKNPDGTAYDLTGATVNLNILLTSGRGMTRTMSVVAPATNGIARYTWLAADWDDTTGLTVGPNLPLQPGTHEHRMEYEAVTGTARVTFPNDSYDTLRVVADVL